MLDRAVAEHERRMCQCGCGHWAEETHDDEGDEEYIVDEVTCHARAALDRFRKEQKEAPPGQLLYVRRKVEGED